MCFIRLFRFLLLSMGLLWDRCKLLWGLLPKWAMHQRANSFAPIPAAPYYAPYSSTAPSSHRSTMWSDDYMCFSRLSRNVLLSVWLLWYRCGVLWRRLSKRALHQRANSAAPNSAAALSPHRLQLQRQSRRGFAPNCVRWQLADLPSRRSI